jgi:hypothetical protein
MLMRCYLLIFIEYFLGCGKVHFFIMVELLFTDAAAIKNYGYTLLDKH